MERRPWCQSETAEGLGCCAEELRSHPEGGGEPLKGCSVESSMVGFVNRTLAGRVNCLGKEVAERRSKQRD